ncbi:MAG: AbrB family transcriptional regulator [Planctomycetes bacterium]|nr:AbrB family transcriptional regulator [Planctomycetota bacterium]
MIRSTLTDRWQTTIPAEVRAALGLRPRQGLLYEIRGESVILRPEGESLMDLAGCLKSDKSAVSKEDARDAARRHVADNFLGRDE